MGRGRTRAGAATGALVLALALAGCSGEETTPAPAPPDADVTTTAEPAPADAATTTPPAAPAPSPRPTPTDTATQTATETPEPVPPPETTTSEPTPEETEEEATGCDGSAMAQDLLGEDIGVTVYECEDDWAYAVYDGGEGDADFVAQRVDGTWVQVAVLGSPTCRDDLREQGAPEVVVAPFLECDEMWGTEPPPAEPTEEPTAEPTEEPTAEPTEEPTAEPTGAPPGGEDCLVATDEYGQTVAQLNSLGCDEAQAIWSEATAQGEPSWDVPVMTSGGYLCWINPFAEESAVAGSCSGPDGEIGFALDVAQG